VNHPAPRSQWLAIAVLAAVILTILLERSYQKHLPPSAVEPSPVFVAVVGAVYEPGIYRLEGHEVTIARAIESAGGFRIDSSEPFLTPEDIAMRSIGTGETIQVANSGRGTMEISVGKMPAAARLTLGEKLDVNSSSEEDLMFVPQMKSGFAAAIVNRRHSKPWRSLEELEGISGVGPRTIERWTNYLKVKESE
jgi:competence protein ComEA